MSTTLTWFNSGLGSKSGTTRDAFFADLRAVVNSKSGDANFKWQEASYSIAGNPRYLVLKRKNGSAGRILIACYTGAPAANNTAVLEGTPTTDAIQLAWFPNGNVDTPSNLAAASGTILGDDTNCTKFANMTSTVTGVYGASMAPYYFDSDDCVWIFTGHLGSSTHFLIGGAGAILVDGSDNEVGAVTAGSSTGFQNFSAATTAFWPWSASDTLAGLATATVFRTNYVGADRLYYQAFQPSGALFTASVGGVSDPMLNTATNTVSFLPAVLMAGFHSPLTTVVKNEGIPLKIRQLAWGPTVAGSFAVYSTTGPVVQARATQPAAGGGNSAWFTNFKV